MLLQFLIVIVEVAELVRQDVGVGGKVESLLSEAFLKSDDVEAEAVLARDFVRLREVVNLLVLVEALILIALAGGGAPKEVPLVAVCRLESLAFQERANELVVEADHLVQKL